MKRLPKSLRKKIRQLKSLIKRQFLDIKEAEQKIKYEIEKLIGKRGDLR